MVGSEVPPPGDYNNEFAPRQSPEEERMRGTGDARKGGRELQGMRRIENARNRGHEELRIRGMEDTREGGCEE